MNECMYVCLYVCLYVSYVKYKILGYLVTLFTFENCPNVCVCVLVCGGGGRTTGTHPCSAWHTHPKVAMHE